MKSEEVRLKAYDLYFMKIKIFFILPQSPLISGTIEEVSKNVLILPQLLQRSKGIEEGWGKLKFLENMTDGGSNALPPM